MAVVRKKKNKSGENSQNSGIVTASSPTDRYMPNSDDIPTMSEDQLKKYKDFGAQADQELKKRRVSDSKFN